MTDPVDTDALALRAKWRELYEDDYEEHVSGCRYLHNNHSYFAGRAHAAAEVDRLRAELDA